MNTQTLPWYVLGPLIALAIVAVLVVWREVWPEMLKRPARDELTSQGLAPAITPLLGLPVWLLSWCCRRPLDVVAPVDTAGLHYTQHFGHCTRCRKVIEFEILHGY